MKARKSINRQAGWTLWGLVGMMALVAFFALLFMKLFPPYMDNYKLYQALLTVAKDPATTTATRRSIITKLDKILYIDYADEIVDLNEAFIITKNKNKMTLGFKYEVVVPLAYNLSALIDFENQVEVK